MYLETPSEGRGTLKSASLAYTKPQVQSSQTRVMAPAGNGSAWLCRQEYQKFKVIFSHLGSWRPFWATNTQKVALKILKQYTKIYICKHSPLIILQSQKEVYKKTHSNKIHTLRHNTLKETYLPKPARWLLVCE